VNPGDIISQRRMPGGECLVVEVWDDWEAYRKQLNEEVPGAGDPVWAKHDFPVLRVLHPSEGLIIDPGYYYETMEEAINHAKRMTMK